MLIRSTVQRVNSHPPNPRAGVEVGLDAKPIMDVYGYGAREEHLMRISEDIILVRLRGVKRSAYQMAHPTSQIVL